MAGRAWSASRPRPLALLLFFASLCAVAAVPIFSSTAGVTKPEGNAGGARQAGLKPTSLRSFGVIHKFRKPPWGGGNQFLLALVGELRRRGVQIASGDVVKEGSKTQLWMANAITFRRNEFDAAAKKHKGTLKLAHRLDGPYYCSRYGKDPRVLAANGDRYRSSEDDRVYEINNEYACASIFQSSWSLEMNRLLGYKPKEPIFIVPNAVDSTIFHSNGRLEWSPARKTRIISSSWSDGERKGFASFAWLDEHLDFSKYDYTFIGNVPPKYKYRNIKVLPPVGSEELAPILRAHDVYIAASFLEPCSNALLEALSSGLPTLYQRGSGHDELVKEGGMGFDAVEEVPGLLDVLISKYKEYQGNIDILSIEQVADKYLEAFETCLT